ncbi:MAG: MgtC/SapB family protein, partial [Ferruginibacter sp.]
MNFKVYFTEVEKVLFANIIGAIIGMENVVRSKSAELKYMILICLGYCLYGILSKEVSEINPDLIASNLLIVVGFIGAGVMFKEKISLNRLITTALISVTAALGMAKENSYAIYIYR